MSRPSQPSTYPANVVDGAPAPVGDAVRQSLAHAKIPASTDALDRAEHGRDWWPLSLASARRGVVEHWPGIVVSPRTTDEVRETILIATHYGVAVTAQGGRSGVEGGAVAPSGGIALDLTGLDRVLSCDVVSGTVTTEAGVFGPELEREVNAHGFTVGHFPQSFDLSTVGGWLACRGAGQYSNRYGKIEDIVRSLTVVLASGDVVHLGGRGPRRATGPDLVQLFVGSEGALGVITEATLVVRPLPAYERRTALAFSSFDDGMAACRNIVQRDAHPAVLRLYDEVESQRTFGVDACVLTVIDEGPQPFVDATMAIVDACTQSATQLDESLVGHWLEHRNDVSALSSLWDAGVVVDTIEVAAPWSVLSEIRTDVLDALRSLAPTLVASVHQSHAYVDGACLYFTFAGRPDEPVPYYRAAWDMATTTTLARGGSLSHHHGVGRNRARFMPEALGSGFDVLRAIKGVLDPMNLLNPGVLGLGGEPW